MLVPEHLLQNLETEHRLTSPPQLTTLTRLDQDMKHHGFYFARGSKSGLIWSTITMVSRFVKTNEERNECETCRDSDKNSKCAHSKPFSYDIRGTTQKTALRKLPATPIGPSKIPVRIHVETPPSCIEQETDPWNFETPPHSTEKRVIKRSYRARTPMVARLRSNKKWEPY